MLRYGWFLIITVVFSIACSTKKSNNPEPLKENYVQLYLNDTLWVPDQISGYSNKGRPVSIFLSKHFSDQTQRLTIYLDTTNITLNTPMSIYAILFGRYLTDRNYYQDLAYRSSALDTTNLIRYTKFDSYNHIISGSFLYDKPCLLQSRDTSNQPLKVHLGSFNNVIYQ